MHLTPDESYRIVEDLLAQTGTALATGDYESFVQAVHFPHHFITGDNVRTYADKEELKPLFRSVRSYYAANGVDRMARVVESLRIESDTKILAETSNHLWRKSELVVAPYTVESVYEKIDGRWGFGSARYGMPPHMAREMTLVPSDTTESLDSDFSKGIQSLLDGMIEDLFAGDFETFKNRFCLPLFLDGRQGAHVVSTGDELRADFDRNAKEFGLIGLTNIVRSLRNVTRYSATRATACYLTYMVGEGDRLISSYDSTLRLRLCADEVWRVSAVLHGPGHMKRRYAKPGPTPARQVFEVVTHLDEEPNEPMRVFDRLH